MASYLKVLIVLISIGLSSSKEKEQKQQGVGGHRKHVVVVSPPKSKQNSDVVIINGHNEGSGNEENVDKDLISSLSNNVMSTTNLLHSQSDTIKDLGNQLKGLENQISAQNERIQNAANLGGNSQFNELKESQKNITSLVNALVVMWTQSEKNYVKIIRSIKNKVKEDNQNLESVTSKLESKLRRMESRVDIIEAGSENARRLAASKRARWPRGHYCILAYGQCPFGFRKNYGFLRGLYMYGTSSQYVKSSAFGSSYIGCHNRDQCGGYNNNYATLNLETCCK